MTSQNEIKAQTLIEKGDKRLKAWFGGSEKYEDAAESYEKAANLFKLAKNWKCASDAYNKAAEALTKAGSAHESATQLVHAANCAKKHNVPDAIGYLQTAISLYTDEGRFSIAAKHTKEIAELYAQEMDAENACEYYKNAADLYEGEGSSSAANSCSLQAAQLLAKQDKFTEAIEVYEKVASLALENSLLKWSVKDYFWRSTICYLASQDQVGARRALERYQDQDASFSQTRECKFLQEIMEAIENYDVEAFTNSVVEYDSISKLDAWKTGMLLKVKQQIKENEEEGGDDDLT